LHGDESLLEALEEAEIPIESGCRMGLCGADPIRVLEGSDNLNSPSEEELATLNRLGLADTCRLACQCRPSGPVTVDVNVTHDKSHALDVVQEDEKTTRVVIIGNGVAGISAAERLRESDARCQIDIIARESHFFYNRMGLARVVYGRSAMTGLYLLPESWFTQNRITVWRNTIADTVNRTDKTVTLGTRETLPYDTLILATGASASVPSVRGWGMAGCFVLREADHALKLRAWCQEQACRSAVVLGGGVLGVEAADALRNLGLHTTIINRSDWLMGRQLDRQGGEILRHYLEGLGISVRCGQDIEAIRGDSRVQEIELTDGERILTDVLLACTGIRPNTELAASAGLNVDRGIVVDERMQTSDSHIYAVGDVAQFGGKTGGFWPQGVEQGGVAASAICGTSATYSANTTQVDLKVRGIDVKCLGELSADGDCQIFEHLDSTATKWRKLVIKDGYIKGAIFVNEPRYARIVGALQEDRRQLGEVQEQPDKNVWEAVESLHR
jgi:NAD(P)H-nitrite reductase large subunit/ferredoxin